NGLATENHIKITESEKFSGFPPRFSGFGGILVMARRLCIEKASQNADVDSVAHPRSRGVHRALTLVASIDHLAFAGVDAHVTRVPQNVAGLRLRARHNPARTLLPSRAARQVHADLAVNVAGEAGAVPTGRRVSAPHIGGAHVA